MVGVPRSKGCQTCLQRRVRCDLTQPECLQCSRRLMKCPGYQKRWKFSHHTSLSVKNDLRTRPQRPRNRFAQPRSTQLGCASDTIDERVEPNLVVRAFDLQGKEIFCSFLLASFPAQFASCGGRVDVNWMDYARQPVLDAPQALTWAFRSLATLHMGRTYHDGEKITSSRHMYSRSLNYLSDLISDTRYQRGAETLATAILLNIYEMQDSLSPLSWLVHARGLASIIQLRGPEAHRTGFGITLLKSCRSILVSEAFVRGGRCFLDQPEWQTFLLEVADSESKSARGSQLGVLVDRAFIEITSCPRWLMETRILTEASLGSAQSTSISPRRLLERMVRSRDTLSNIQQQLEIGLSRQGLSSTDASWEEFIGPIAANFLGAFAQSALNGIRLAIALLDHLLEIVRLRLLLLEQDSDSYTSLSSVSGSPRSFIVNPWSELGSNSGTWELDFDPDHGLSLFCMSRKTSAWMDRVVMSMGLLGVRPKALSHVL
ncbi:Zn(II)2Cys6 transcription factor [Aspergillus lucknowensis]|uniref:Zn(2)-C6 fungal-type domain-containing protein n=1 Tax=Aspergillus lucknowensis TaxID=176173 RepID=A0ABR4L5U3_9EURO